MFKVILQLKHCRFGFLLFCKNVKNKIFSNFMVQNKLLRVFFLNYFLYINFLFTAKLFKCK